MIKKIAYLDILKCIALFCVVLAHVSPPQVVFQIRNFDVVLLILISAYLGLLKFNDNTKVISYLIKRFVRLVIPTWIFLTFLFIILYVFNINIGMLNVRNIILTYSLSNSGLGYVWIIRIYLIISILIPIYKILSSKLQSKVIFVMSVILYLIYELLCNYGFFDNFYINYFLAYLIPCFLLINIFHYLFNQNSKFIYWNIVICAILLIIIAIVLYFKTGQVQPTQIFKYPFRTYYLSYGLLVGSLLIVITRKKSYCHKFIVYICNHSIWFYLWHILFLFLFNMLKINWVIELILIVISCSIVIFVQEKIINLFKQKGINSKILKIFEG